MMTFINYYFLTSISFHLLVPASIASIIADLRKAFINILYNVGFKCLRI